MLGKTMGEDYNIRRLKTVVIGLGVVILLFVSGIIGGLVWKYSASNRPTRSVTSTLPVAPQAATTTPALIPAVPLSGLASAKSFEARKIDLPKGSRVIEVRTEVERLILRIRHLGGNEQIQLYNINSGELLGVFEIESAE